LDIDTGSTAAGDPAMRSWVWVWVVVDSRVASRAGWKGNRRPGLGPAPRGTSRPTGNGLGRLEGDRGKMNRGGEKGGGMACRPAITTSPDSAGGRQGGRRGRRDGKLGRPHFFFFFFFFFPGRGPGGPGSRRPGGGMTPAACRARDDGGHRRRVVRGRERRDAQAVQRAGCPVGGPAGPKRIDVDPEPPPPTPAAAGIVGSRRPASSSWHRPGGWRGAGGDRLLARRPRRFSPREAAPPAWPEHFRQVQFLGQCESASRGRLGHGGRIGKTTNGNRFGGRPGRAQAQTIHLDEAVRGRPGPGRPGTRAGSADVLRATTTVSTPASGRDHRGQSRATGRKRPFQAKFRPGTSSGQRARAARTPFGPREEATAMARVQARITRWQRGGAKRAGTVIFEFGQVSPAVPTMGRADRSRELPRAAPCSGSPKRDGLSPAGPLAMFHASTSLR